MSPAFMSDMQPYGSSSHPPIVESPPKVLSLGAHDYVRDSVWLLNLEQYLIKHGLHLVLLGLSYSSDWGVDRLSALTTRFKDGSIIDYLTPDQLQQDCTNIYTATETDRIDGILLSVLRKREDLVFRYMSTVVKDTDTSPLALNIQAEADVYATLGQFYLAMVEHIRPMEMDMKPYISLPPARKYNEPIIPYTKRILAHCRLPAGTDQVFYPKFCTGFITTVWIQGHDQHFHEQMFESLSFVQQKVKDAKNIWELFTCLIQCDRQLKFSSKPKASTSKTPGNDSSGYSPLRSPGTYSLQLRNGTAVQSR